MTCAHRVRSLDNGYAHFPPDQLVRDASLQPPRSRDAHRCHQQRRMHCLAHASRGGPTYRTIGDRTCPDDAPRPYVYAGRPRATTDGTCNLIESSANYYWVPTISKSIMQARHPRDAASSPCPSLPPHAADSTDVIRLSLPWDFHLRCNFELDGSDDASRTYASAPRMVSASEYDRLLLACTCMART